VISSPRPIDGAEEPEEAPDIGLLLPYNVVMHAEGLGSLAKSAREPDHQKRSSPSAAALIAGCGIHAGKQPGRRHDTPDETPPPDQSIIRRRTLP
jgi:hypothetical protein